MENWLDNLDYQQISHNLWTDKVEYTDFPYEKMYVLNDDKAYHFIRDGPGYRLKEKIMYCEWEIDGKGGLVCNVKK